MKLLNIKLSISRKLTIIYTSILLGILIFFTLLTFFTIRNLTIKDSENELSLNADIISNYIISTKSIDSESLKNINLSQGIFFSVYDNEKNIIYTNSSGHEMMGRNFGGGKRGFRGRPNEFGRGTIYVSRTVDINDNEYYIQVTRDFDDIGAKAGMLAEILVITGILGTIVAFISGSFLSKKLLRPIQDITNTAKDITSKNLDKRIKTNGANDELKDLADTINSMIERLETDFEKQKRFVSDASHELRTPLSVIHGHVNMLNRWGKDDPELLEKSLATLKMETDSMNRLIQNLLYLARGDNNKLEFKREEFQLFDMLKEVVDETKLNYGQYNISFLCKDNLSINADYNALKQVLRILVDNSIKFTVPPGKIIISGEREERKIKIVVSDNGAGIPKESIPYIFDRFYRADESRTKATGGTGLGLAIAKQIVEGHGGSISAESKLGEGTTINIYFDS